MRNIQRKAMYANIALCMFDGIAEQMKHLSANCGPDYQREVNTIAKVALRGRRKAFDIVECCIRKEKSK